MHDFLQAAVWQALTTSQSHLSLTNGGARRYPADVAPFAAIQAPTPEALEDLLPLLTPGESLYLLGPKPPDVPGLRWDGVLPCLQMLFPETAPILVSSNPQLVAEPLGCDHADEMLALIHLAYPGFFRQQTCRLGPYWGFRDADGTLVAMGGDRIVFNQTGDLSGGTVWREISGLCTHPARPGKGLGTALLLHILAQHRAEGSRSWLHVSEDNTRAVNLYNRVGFQTVRHIAAHRLQRVAP